MADLDKDGIPDNVDSDGGRGTGASGLTASEQALINSLQGLTAQNGGEATGRNTTGSSTEVIRLTENTARALMTKAAMDADFTGKFSSADVASFIREFDAEQNKQIGKVVVSSATKTTPGAVTDSAVESTRKTEYPSFFDPLQFAKDYVWKKIDFKNEATLGAKSLDALGKIRGVIESFNLLGVSDAEAKIAAKQVAMGKKTVEDYTVELQKLAAREYPTLAGRFATDPTLTTYDIASPIINMLAKTWQVDPKTIKLDNPLVLEYLRPGGADGKGNPPSYNELLMKAKNDSRYDLTTEANELARDAATGLGRALGFGV